MVSTGLPRAAWLSLGHGILSPAAQAQALVQCHSYNLSFSHVWLLKESWAGYTTSTSSILYCRGEIFPEYSEGNNCPLLGQDILFNCITLSSILSFMSLVSWCLGIKTSQHSLFKLTLRTLCLQKPCHGGYWVSWVHLLHNSQFKCLSHSDLP